MRPNARVWRKPLRKFFRGERRHVKQVKTNPPPKWGSTAKKKEKSDG